VLELAQAPEELRARRLVGGAAFVAQAGRIVGARAS
jgi:hypothetical protein